MPISEQTFKQVALEDPEGHWELHCGYLRRKPGMTARHNDLMDELHFAIRRQVDRKAFAVRNNKGHVHVTSQNYYIPDLFVIPVELMEPLWGTRQLEAYEAPLPLVVEVWSPSTGAFDVATKVPEYQRRGDLEIWRIHPYEHTLTAWRRQPDGGYSETHYSGGTIQPIAVPNVTVDLDALFQ
jgi:Uma2 family endonuclease